MEDTAQAGSRDGKWVRARRTIGRFPGGRFLPRRRSRKLLNLGFLGVLVTAVAYFGTIVDAWKASEHRTILLDVVLAALLFVLLLAGVSALVSPDERESEKPVVVPPPSEQVVVTPPTELDPYWTER